MKVSVVGTGYVGLVTGVCFAELGNEVLLVDVVKEKLEKIEKGIPPIFEEGLEELLKKNLSRIKTTQSAEEAVLGSDVTFICVGTPSKPDGSIDLKYIEEAARDIGAGLMKKTGYHVVVVKSTVVPGTSEKVLSILEEASGKKAGKEFGVAMNPEFLREGKAVKDFLKPDRIVIGELDKRSGDLVGELYSGFGCPVMRTGLKTAEMIKYANNALLATKVSYSNDIGNVCKELGIDVYKVMEGVGLDHRLSPHFLNAGIGFGGSCLNGEDFVFLGNPSLKMSTFEHAYEENHNKSNVFGLGFGEQSEIVPVRVLTKRTYEGNFVKIKTWMSRRLEVTEDHPMIVVDNGSFKVKLAGDLKQGDRLPLAISLPTKPVKRIDLISEFERENLDARIKVRPLERSFSALKRKLYPFIKRDKYTRYEFFRKNYTYLDIFKSLEKLNLIPFGRKNLLLFTSKGNTTYTPAIIELDEMFWRLVGYYLAEGNISYEKCERGTRAKIQFHFHMKEKEYIKDVCGILKKMHIKYRIQQRTKVTTIVVSSRIFAYLLDNVLKCGTDSYTANIPSITFFETEGKKKALLCGLFRGDGHVRFHNHSKAITVTLGTASERLAHGTILLLQSMGIIAGHKIKWMKKSKVPAHLVQVSCRDQVKKLVFFDRRTNQLMEKRLNSYKKHISPIGFKKHEGYATVAVRDIKKQWDKKIVYSLEFNREPHMFITSGGIIVHNCFPKDVAAIVAAGKSLDYSPLVLESVLELNKRQPLRMVNILKKRLPELKGKTVAVLGLAFKPGTDDIREAPSIKIIRELLEEGAAVNAWDPKAVESFRKEFPDINYFNGPREALKEADACLVVTEWPELGELEDKDFDQMRTRIIIEGRKVLNPEKVNNFEGVCW